MLRMIPQLLLSSEIEHFEVGPPRFEGKSEILTWLTESRPTKKETFSQKNHEKIRILYLLEIGFILLLVQCGSSKNAPHCGQSAESML